MGIAAERGVEDPEVQAALQRHHQDRHRDHRRAQDHDDARRVVRPDEQGQPEPGQARRPHLVDGDDEVEAGEDGREAGDEDAEAGGDDVGVRVVRAVGDVEGPARVHPAREHRVHREGRPRHVDVPAQQVEAREGEVLGADHHGDEEIAQGGGDGRDQEEEHHDDAVHGEELVVGLRLHHVALRRDQLEADEGGEDAADREHHGDARQVEEGDALVVRGQQPRLHAVAHVQVVDVLARARPRPLRRGRGDAGALVRFGGSAGIGAHGLRGAAAPPSCSLPPPAPGRTVVSAPGA